MPTPTEAERRETGGLNPRSSGEGHPGEWSLTSNRCGHLVGGRVEASLHPHGDIALQPSQRGGEEERRVGVETTLPAESEVRSLVLQRGETLRHHRVKISNSNKDVYVTCLQAVEVPLNNR